MTDLCQTVVKRAPKEWPNTADIINAIATNPDVISQYDKNFEIEDVSTVLHNLPAPEFEDTGFLGRREQVDELDKAIRGPYPVITILGVGGVGKTALAVHAAYALAERTDCPFDAIIWTSAKTTRLTRVDIEQINGAIKDSIGIASDALMQFGVSTTDNPFADLLDLLSSFKVLLFIDNLETILDQRIRDFVKEVPPGSKIVFTSRIGLGAFDFTIPLGSLPGKESDRYFRRVAKVWNQDALASLPKDQVKAYCTRLDNNPLGIKWFTQAVAAGASPQVLVANPQQLLKFCLENILDKLTSDAKDVLEALAITGRNQTPAALTFLCEVSTETCQEALRVLFTSNLISITAGQIGHDDKYQITPIALTYISRHFSPSASRQDYLRKRQSALNKLEIEADIRPDDQYVYDPSFIFIRRECAGTDAVAAGFLRRASADVLTERFPEALSFVEDAKKVAPNYFEALRVEAFAAAQSGNIMRAHTAYEEAVALRPDHPPLRVWYAGFLLRYLDDPDGAIDQLDIAKSLDPNELMIRIELARSFLHLLAYDRVLQITEDIDISQSRNARLTRVYHDLIVQVHVRRADQMLDRGQSELFVLDAEALLVHIDSLPQHVIDARITRHIRHMIGSSRRFVSKESGSPLGLRAEKVMKSLEARFAPPSLSTDATDGKYLGRIFNLPAGQKFGFLEMGSGDRLFFHKTSFPIAGSFDSLELGNEVTFEMGKNAQGQCAVNVIPVTFSAL